MVNFTKIIKEEVGNIIQEADRHRPGYYKEYNERRKKEGKSTDRHRPGYYEEYEEKRTNRGKRPDRHRKNYYHDYNKAHPERLDRGYTTGYKNGNVSDGPIDQQNRPRVDFMGRPITNDSFNDLLRNKESQWYDDDVFGA